MPTFLGLSGATRLNALDVPSEDYFNHPDPNRRCKAFQSLTIPLTVHHINMMVEHLCVDENSKVRETILDRLPDLLIQEYAYLWEAQRVCEEIAGMSNPWISFAHPTFVDQFYKDMLVDPNHEFYHWLMLYAREKQRKTVLALEDTLDDPSLKRSGTGTAESVDSLTESFVKTVERNQLLDYSLLTWRDHVFFALHVTLDDPSVIIRYKAVKALKLLMDPRAIQKFIELMLYGNNDVLGVNHDFFQIQKTSEYNVRSEAALSLLAFLPYLKDSDTEDRSRLKEISDSFFLALKKETDWVVLSHLFRGIVLMQPDLAIPDLYAFSKGAKADNEEKKRYAALRSEEVDLNKIQESASLELTKIHTTSNTDHLVELMRLSPFWNVREKAVETIGIMGTYRLMPYLLKQLEREDRFEVRVAIIRTLGKIGDEEMVTFFYQQILSLQKQPTSEANHTLIQTYNEGLIYLGEKG